MVLQLAQKGFVCIYGSFPFVPKDASGGRESTKERDIQRNLPLPFKTRTTRTGLTNKHLCLLILPKIPCSREY